MPTQKVLEQKQALVKDLTQKLNNASFGVLVNYKGIDVLNDTNLRRELRDSNVDYLVVKNTLLRLAVKEAGLDDLLEHLVGTTAIALSDEDQIVAAKVLSKYSKDLKNTTEFAIKSGFMDGKVIDAKLIIELGSLPPKDQMVGQLLSVIVAPIRGLAVALGAIVEKMEAGEDFTNSKEASDKKIDVTPEDKQEEPTPEAKDSKPSDENDKGKPAADEDEAKSKAKKEDNDSAEKQPDKKPVASKPKAQAQPKDNKETK